MKNLILLLTLVFSIIGCKKEEEEDKLIVYSLSDKVAGYDMSQLGIEASKWSFTNPLDNGPLSDADGSFHKKQPLPDVTILAPNLGETQERSLIINSKNPIFIPAMGVTGWYYANDACNPDWNPKAGQSVLDFLQKELSGVLEGATNVKVVLNGQPLVPDMKARKTTTALFTMKVDQSWNSPDCNYTGKDASAYAEDYTIALKLPKGNHILKVAGEFKDINLVQDITWKLTVQ